MKIREEKKMRKMTQRAALGAAGFALVLATTVAFAQQTPPTRIRGVIEKVDGNTLTIKARNGSDMTVKMADNYTVMAFVKASMADIKPNSYIGVTAMPEADGTQRAIGVHIFMETQRGTGEGFRAWDLRPNSTMTNAAVASAVTSVNGQEVMVKYKDGEKKVLIEKDTPIVAFAAGDKADIKPGAQIIIFAAAKQPDGSLTADRINVGRGVTPPM
jgi:outer membrane lipoprotein SlyB